MIPEPLAIWEVKPEQLHETWPFILRGLEVIKRRIKPDWIPVDLYSYLVSENSRCLIAQRGQRHLGFVIYGKDVYPHSRRVELFIRAAWNLPIREQREADCMPETVLAMWRCLVQIAKTALGTNRIGWWTTANRARAFEKKYGWKPMHTGFHIEVD